MPDISILHPRADFYADGHPGPGDILVLLEVADASLLYDSNTKLPLYARAGIAEVWLDDLVRNAVEGWQGARGTVVQSARPAGRR